MIKTIEAERSQMLFFFVSSQKSLAELTDQELIPMIESKEVPVHSLESVLKDHERAVNLRSVT